MSSRPPQPDEHNTEAQVNPASLGAALSGLSVPDHGPTFWADLDNRLEGDTVPEMTESRELHQPPVTGTGPAHPTPTSTTEPSAASLDERRARRGGRLTRSLGAAAAAVALVLVTAGVVTVINGNDGDSRVETADRPAGTAQPGPEPSSSTTQPAFGAPFEEFSATYEGIDRWDGTDSCCSPWRFTLARDGSFRYAATNGRVDMAYDATTGRHVEVSRRADDPQNRLTGFARTGVPAGGPDQLFATPEPLGPMADFVVALARAGDPRVTIGTVAGRATWHYDGPTVQDRFGGDSSPNHAVVDVDQTSGVLLELTRRFNEHVVSRFTASDVTTADQIDRTRYQLEAPSGARSDSLGFTDTTLDQAATGLPYDLLVPGQVPAGFELESVEVNRTVASPTGAEAANPPTKPVVALTWRRGSDTFTVSLRPMGGQEWDDPLGAEGLVLDRQPVRLELADRPPLEGQVAVDPPIEPHLWGITGDIVVTVSGDLPRADLEKVAGSLRPHQG